MIENNIGRIKTFLLSKAIIQLHPDNREQDLQSSSDNIGRNQWIFYGYQLPAEFGFLFCPLTYQNSDFHCSWKMMQRNIYENLYYQIRSVSFTTSCPANITTDEIV